MERSTGEMVLGPPKSRAGRRIVGIPEVFIPALREHPHIGWLLVRSAEHGPLALGRNGTRHLSDGRVEGDDLSLIHI